MLSICCQHSCVPVSLKDKPWVFRARVCVFESYDSVYSDPLVSLFSNARIYDTGPSHVVARGHICTCLDKSDSVKFFITVSIICFYLFLVNQSFIKSQLVFSNKWSNMFAICSCPSLVGCLLNGFRSPRSIKCCTRSPSTNQ